MKLPVQALLAPSPPQIAGASFMDVSINVAALRAVALSLRKDLALIWVVRGHSIPAPERHPPRVVATTTRGIQIVIAVQTLVVVMVRNVVKEALLAGILFKLVVLSRAAPAPSVAARNRMDAPVVPHQSVTTIIVPATIRAGDIVVVQASAPIVVHVILMGRMRLIVTAHQTVATVVLVRGSTRAVVRIVVVILAHH